MISHSSLAISRKQKEKNKGNSMEAYTRTLGIITISKGYEFTEKKRAPNQSRRREVDSEHVNQQAVCQSSSSFSQFYQHMNRSNELYNYRLIGPPFSKSKSDWKLMNTSSSPSRNSTPPLISSTVSLKKLGSENSSPTP